MPAAIPAAMAIAAALGLCVAGSPTAFAGNTPPQGSPSPPRDAAERVQEGNVQNWIEYYRRTRQPSAPDPAQPAPGAPAGSDTPKDPQGAAKRAH